MINAIQTFLNDNAKTIIASGISLLGGYALNKFLNRTRSIKYWTNISRIGFSANDMIFGEITITHNGRNVNSIYYAELWVMNDSGVDIQDFNFNIYGELKILGEMRRIHNSSNIFDWSERFKSLTHVPEGGQPTDFQISTYFGAREYSTKVFNRYETLKLELLVESINGAPPAIYADARHKGVRIKRITEGPKVHGEDVRTLAIISLSIIAASTLSYIFVFAPSHTVFVLAIILATFAQSVSAALLKLFRIVKRAFA